jgi:hypothetical protein
MSHTAWIRLGSLAALIGGSIAALFAGVDLTRAILQLLDQQSSLGLALFHVWGVTEAAPALWLLYVLALIGLQVRGASRAGSLTWPGITAAVIGAVIVGLGNGLDATIVYSQADQCRTPLDCNIYDPSHYLMIGLMLGLLGSTIFALGMIHYGIVALTSRVLLRYNWLLLVVGAMALLNVAVSVSATLATSGTDYAGTQKVAILLAAVALASATVWVFLGAALWPREHQETIAQVIPAEPVV